MRIAFLLLLSALLVRGDLSVREIIAKTLAEDDLRQRALRGMQYNQMAVIDQLDWRNAVMRHQVLEMTMQPGGNPPMRVTSLTGERVPALSDRAAVQALADDVEGNKQTFTLRDLANRFELKLEGGDELDGAPAYRLAFAPKPGQRFANDTEKVVNQLRGRIWISARTFCVLRTEARLTHRVRVAWFLASVPVLEFEYRTKESVSGFADEEERITLEVDAPFVGYHERQVIAMTGFRSRGGG